MAWGEYPAEYNPKVHGPYDPARFYGKGNLLYLFARNQLPIISFVGNLGRPVSLLNFTGAERW